MTTVLPEKPQPPHTNPNEGQEPPHSRNPDKKRSVAGVAAGGLTGISAPASLMYVNPLVGTVLVCTAAAVAFVLIGILTIGPTHLQDNIYRMWRIATGRSEPEPPKS